MLTSDTWYNIMIHTDYHDILQLCQLHKSICDDEHFWHEKFNMDFGDFHKINTWRESYKIMLKALSYHEKLKEMGVKMIFNLDMNQGPDKIKLDDKLLPTPFSENSMVEYSIIYGKQVVVDVKNIVVRKAKWLDESDHIVINKNQRFILTNKQGMLLLYILSSYNIKPIKKDMFSF
jgi:hypothetical protein